MAKPLSQMQLLLGYFRDNPNKEISHPEIVDWATEEWLKQTGKVLRDPDRAIRSLAQKGYLIKISNGVYKYDPDYIELRELEDFTPRQKEIILERDGYRCAYCGRGKNEGITLHVDHIRPKEFGGKASIENGQTLCAQHNFQKKVLKQTELGKKMFIRLYEIAKSENDPILIKFTSELLEVFERNNIDDHITWER